MSYEAHYDVSFERKPRLSMFSLAMVEERKRDGKTDYAAISQFKGILTLTSNSHAGLGGY